MTTYLPTDVQAGLDAARKSARTQSRRLRVETGGESYPVLHAWEDGFALDANTAPQLRGRITMFDGSRLLSYGLIVASDHEGAEIHCDYKRISDAHDTQPLDFYREPDAPVALIGSA